MADDARTYVPLGEVIAQEVWPADFFGAVDFDFLNTIAYIDSNIFDDEVNTNIELGLEVMGELAFELPFGVALIVGAGPADFSLSGDDSGFSSWTNAEVLKLRLPRELFVPLIEGTNEEDPAPDRFVEIVFPVGVGFDSRGNFDLAWPAEGRTPLSLERCRIGNTGVIIEASDVLVRFSEAQELPDAAGSAGIAPDFRGLYIGSASVELDEGLASAIPAGSEFRFENCFIGTGGFTGKLTVDPGADPAGELFGATFIFQSFSLEIEQNALTRFELAGALDLDVLDEPLDVIVSLDLDGQLLIRVAQEGGLLVLGIDDIFDFTVDKIEFEVNDTGRLAVRSSGTLTPTFQPGFAHIDWPGIRLENLEIDSEGNVRIAGGWIDLPDQATLSLFGFILEITRIGFGKTEAGRNWIGFNGSLQIMEGIPAGASVEGLRIIWGGPDPSAATELTMEGIGVEVEVPGAIKFAGHVSLVGPEFAGAVRVELPAISFQLDGQFVAGTVENTNPPVKTYAVFLQMQLPAGIPLGPTGLAFYGLAGLFAHNREPAKLPGEGWYRNPDFSDGWFTRKTGTPALEGVTDVQNKWRGAKGSLGLGAGVIIGTFPDNGYVFNGRLLLVLAFPGPVILIDGMANLFRKRTELGSAEPNFHALVVIEPKKSILAGLDAQYRFKDEGEVMDIHGSAEAFYSFEDSSAWFINIGVDQPIQRRIGARIFQLFDVNAFFMLNAKSLSIGAGWRYDKRFGFKHLFVRLFASMEGQARVSWHPTHFTGSIGLEGGAEACAFGICAGLSVGAEIRGDVFDPFGLEGSFRVGINLPWPLPDISRTLTLSWSHDFTDPRGPAVPVPLREVSIEHLKTGNTWPMLRGKSLRADDGPDGRFEFERPGGEPAGMPADVMAPFADEVEAPRIPADSKVAITFTRPTKDALPVAQASVDVRPEAIGDPRPNAGAAYTVGYTLSSVQLQKWAPGGEGTDGSAGWRTVLEGGPGPEEEGRLFGEWVPGQEEPNEGHSEQHKLVLNALTPFDYTAQRSSTWEEAFFANNPGYPCQLAVPELSARFTQPIGTVLEPIHTFDDPMPGFSVSWAYGGEIAESEEIISTVLGPLDRGLRLGIGGTITPPPNTSTFTIRVGTSKELAFFERARQLGNPGTVANPIPAGDGVVHAFDGLSEPTLRANNTITRLTSSSGTGLEIGDRLEIELHSPSVMAEVEVELLSFLSKPKVEIFAVLADGTELGRRQPPVGLSQARFRTAGSLIVRVVIERRSRTLQFGVLRRVSARKPLEILVSRVGGLPPVTMVESNGSFLIDGLGVISNISYTSGIGRGLILLEIALPAGHDELIRRTATSLNRLTKEDPLFEPEADYRLVVSTNRNDQALGSNSAAVLTHNRDLVNHAYFHVVGPPGIGVPDPPPNQNSEAKAGLALDDLRLYVEQTLPPSIPTDGGKLLVPRAFYRGYDVAVKFNVPHAELLYLRARRDLSVRLFDVDDTPVLTTDGRVSIPTPSWERSRQQSLTDSVSRWIAAVNESTCRPDDLPPFDASTVVRPQVLGAPGTDVVLAAQTLHQARLVPVLLHETFVAPLSGLIADGSAHRFERWFAEGASRWEMDSETIADPVLGSVTTFFVSEVNGSTATLVYAGPLNHAQGPDAPGNWSDFRASLLVRWNSGIVGVDFRRASGGDLLRLALDRGASTRRLLSVRGGTSTELAQSAASFPSSATDVPITVECVGDRVRVYFGDDAEPTFDEVVDPALAGSIGLYVEAASLSRFSEIRVDDLRPSPSTAFSFDFVSSKYTNFYHHLHSFPDRLFDGAPGAALTATDLSAHSANAIDVRALGTVEGLGGVSDNEWRSFDVLEAKALGPAALQPAEAIEVHRVSAAGAPLALLLRSPEPLLWERTLLEVSSRASAGALEVPGNLKLSDVAFGASPAAESATILVRSRGSLAQHRLEWRPLPSAGEPNPAWRTYYEFGTDEPELADGTQVHVLALASTDPIVPQREPGTVQRFVAFGGAAPEVHFTAPGVELRLLDPDGSSVHGREFASPEAFSSFPMRALRKLDGTALVLFVDGAGPVPDALRLLWTFNRVAGDEDLRFRQGGSETPESAVLDFALEPSA